MTDAESKLTPLYEEHRQLGAKIVPFGGWLMPVQYSGIIDEHQAVRKNVGVFDISHMGQLIATGADARKLAQRDADQRHRRNSTSARANTHFLLNESGGVIDDLIVYRTATEEFLARRECLAHGRRFRLAAENISFHGVDLMNRSAGYAGSGHSRTACSLIYLRTFFGEDATPRREIKSQTSNTRASTSRSPAPVTRARTALKFSFRQQMPPTFGIEFWRTESRSASNRAASARVTRCDWRCVIR